MAIPINSPKSPSIKVILECSMRSGKSKIKAWITLAGDGRRKGGIIEE